MAAGHDLRRSVSSASPSTTSCTENRSVPPPGIASRALTTTLSIAASNSLTSMRAGCGSPCRANSSLMFSGIECSIRTRVRSSTPLMSTVLGLSMCRRENVSSWRVRGGAVRRVAHRLEQPADRAEVAASIRETRLPEITVSRVEIVGDAAGELTDRLQPRSAATTPRHARAARFPAPAWRWSAEVAQRERLLLRPPQRTRR